MTPPPRREEGEGLTIEKARATVEDVNGKMVSTIDCGIWIAHGFIAAYEAQEKRVQAYREAHVELHFEGCDSCGMNSATLRKDIDEAAARIIEASNKENQK